MNYKDYYENLAELQSFWDLPENSPRYYQDKIRYDLILSHLPKTVTRVLDLGCGDGYLSFLMAQAGLRVTGVDISLQRMKKFEQIARENRIRRVIANVCAAGLANDSFDRVVCSEVIEHIEDYHAVLQEAFRILKPGGSLIVTVPYKEQLKAIICPHCQRAFNQDGHLHSFDKEKLTEALTRAGFTVAKTRTLRHRLLVHLQYHTSMKYGFLLRNLDRLFSWLTPEFTRYLLVVAQK